MAACSPWAALLAGTSRNSELLDARRTSCPSRNQSPVNFCHRLLHDWTVFHVRVTNPECGCTGLSLVLTAVRPALTNGVSRPFPKTQALWRCPRRNYKSIRNSLLVMAQEHRRNLCTARLDSDVRLTTCDRTLFSQSTRLSVNTPVRGKSGASELR